MTKTSEHWHYRETSGFDYGSTIYSIPGVCTNIDNESDARLIAAAPELLETLQAFIDGGYDRETAITAIAKATGETK